MLFGYGTDDWCLGANLDKQRHSFCQLSTRACYARAGWNRTGMVLLRRDFKSMFYSNVLACTAEKSMVLVKFD